MSIAFLLMSYLSWTIDELFAAVAVAAAVVVVVAMEVVASQEQQEAVSAVALNWGRSLADTWRRALWSLLDPLRRQ